MDDDTRAPTLVRLVVRLVEWLLDPSPCSFRAVLPGAAHDTRRNHLRVLVPAIAVLPTDDVDGVEGVTKSPTGASPARRLPVRPGALVGMDGTLKARAPAVVERARPARVSTAVPAEPHAVAHAPADFQAPTTVPRNVRRAW